MEDFIDNIFTLIFAILGIIILISLIGGIGAAIFGHPIASTYTYIDEDGNSGTAESCDGTELLTCKSGGRRFKVKEYTKQ